MNYKYKCIAIDDEPLALSLIEAYIKKTPELEFAGAYSNAMQAMENAGAQMTDKPVKATINAYFEIPKSYTKKKVQAIINGEIKPAKPDLDNIIKCIDGCNKIIFKDDVQIYSINATKSYITNLQRYGVHFIFEWDD